MDPLITALAPFGLQGLVIAALLYALRSRDQELTAERRGRLEDAQKTQQFALELQQRMLGGLDKCHEISEAFGKALEEIRRARR